MNSSNNITPFDSSNVDFIDRIPRIILFSKDKNDVRIYAKLVDFCKEQGTDTVLIPPLAELGRMVGMGNHRKVKAVLDRLHETKWIEILNLNQARFERFNIRIKYQTFIFGTQTNVSEAIINSSQNKSVTRYKKINNLDNDLSDNIETVNISLPPGGFPPHLKNLHATCIKLDSQNRSLASYSEEMLFQQSMGASFFLIECAMIEVEGTGKSNKRANSILECFASRFMLDNTGKSILNPNRNSKSKKRVPTQSPAEYVPVDPPNEKYHLKPTELFSCSDIDNLCERLMIPFQWIAKGDLPMYIFPIQADWLLTHQEEPQHLVKLNPIMELIKIKSGFWRIEYIKKKLPVVRELVEVCDAKN